MEYQLQDLIRGMEPNPMSPILAGHIKLLSFSRLRVFRHDTPREPSIGLVVADSVSFVQVRGWPQSMCLSSFILADSTHKYEQLPMQRSKPQVGVRTTLFSISVVGRWIDRHPYRLSDPVTHTGHHLPAVSP